jgi:hypothetical protein
MTEDGMVRLTHSAAHERVADLALEPGALDVLMGDLDAAAGSAIRDPLIEHVASCPACRAEIESWQHTHRMVRDALAGSKDAVALGELAQGEAVQAPADLRAAVRGLVVRGGDGEGSGPEGTGGAPEPLERRARRLAGLRFLPLVAALAVLAIGGGYLLNQTGQLDRARADTAALASVTATLDRVMIDPQHRVVSLRATDGTIDGSVAWTSHDLVILTTALTQPPADKVYRCWIERDGKRSPVGRMFFAGGTGYWTGSLDAWATTSFVAGTTFGISLEPVSGSIGAPAVLVGDLGS